jgi:hypothetical protein
MGRKYLRYAQAQDPLNQSQNATLMLECRNYNNTSTWLIWIIHLWTSGSGPIAYRRRSSLCGQECTRARPLLLLTAVISWAVIYAWLRAEAAQACTSTSAHSATSVHLVARDSFLDVPSARATGDPGPSQIEGAEAKFR